MVFEKDIQTELYLENKGSNLYELACITSDIKPDFLCSICLDIYVEPKFLNCLCIFCKSCLQAYLKSRSDDDRPCPICQEPIVECYSNEVGRFNDVLNLLNSAEQRLKNELKLDVIPNLSFGDIMTILQENHNTSSIDQLIPTDDNDYSKLLECHKLLITKDSKILTTEGEIPHGSNINIANILTESQKKKYAALKTPAKRSDHKNKRVLISEKRLGTNTTIAKTFKKEKIKQTFKLKINDSAKEFQDSSTKTDIINWLTDNRNKFQHILTPEENNSGNSQIPPNIDLCSVSQRHKNRLVSVPPISQINKQKLEQTRIRQKNKTIFQVSHGSYRLHNDNKRRTRSLEYAIKTTNVKPAVKRHSITIGENPEIIIEQSDDEIAFNTIQNPEKKIAIVDLMEEEYINKIDSELEQNKETNTKRATQDSLRMQKKMPSLIQKTIAEANKRLESVNASSAWDRVKEIKKTMRKTERKTHKLKIAEVVHTSLTGSTTSNRTTLNTRRNNSGSDFANCPNTIYENSSTSYDLNRLDEYFNKKKDMLQPDKAISETITCTNPPTKCSTKLEDSISSSFGKYNKNKRSLKSIKNIVNLKVVDNIPTDSFKSATKENQHKQIAATDSSRDSKNQSETKLISRKPDVNNKESSLAYEPEECQKHIQTNKSDNSTKKAKNNFTETVVNLVRLPLTENSQIKSVLKSADTLTKPNLDSKIKESQSKIQPSEEMKSCSDINDIKSKVKKTTENLEDLVVLTSVHNTFEMNVNKAVFKKPLPLQQIHPGDTLKKVVEDTETAIDQVVSMKCQSNGENAKEEVGNFMNFSPTEEVSVFKSAIITCHEDDETSEDSDNGIFLIPTQVNQIGTQHKQHQTSEDDDIFLIPTQVNQIVTQHKEHQTSKDNEILTAVTPIVPVTDENRERTVACLKDNVILLKQTLNEFMGHISEQECLTKLKNITKTIELLTDHISVEVMPETRDVDSQTNGSCDIFSLSVSTQTLNPIKHVAVQTECESPGGFHISSSAIFNIQPGVSVEIQTEPLQCAKCTSDVHPTTIEPATTEVLSTDKNLIKSPSNKYTLSEWFDNIDFDTQDAIKGNKILVNSKKQDNTSGSKENSHRNKSLSLKDLDKPQQSMTHSTHVIPQTSHNSIDDKKVCKRVRRSSSSDSESDEIKKLQAKIKKNKFMDEELSIHFVSEDINEVADSPKKDHCGFTLSEESDGINYKEVLDNIIKKIDEDKSTNLKSSNKSLVGKRSREQNVGSNSKININESGSKRTKTQDVIKECEMIIKNACSESIRFEDTQQSTIKEPSKLTLAVLEKEFENNFDDSITEVVQQVHIAKTSEKEEIIKNKYSETLFSDDNFVNKSLGSSQDNDKDNREKHSKQCLNDIIDNFNKMNDSFEDDLDAEVAAINIKQNDLIVKEKAIILGNVTVLPPESFADNPKVQNETTPKPDHSNSVEIFISDSDSEVVESTPEKNKIPSIEQIAILSQQYLNKEEHLSPIISQTKNPAQETCFVETFAPPPEFQDEPDTAFNENSVIAIPELRPSSLTPDLLLSQDLPPRKKKSLITSTPFTQSSQIIAYSLNLSPIKCVEESTSLNPLQAAQNSKELPLKVVKNKVMSTHSRLHTNTPKQKSMLNYVQQYKRLDFSQSSRTSQVSQKPCVACTRLNKEQSLAILSLSKKKLITFSNSFNSSVTHMIVIVNENQCLKDHTMKHILAVASGIWVLSFCWIEECIKQRRLVPEEPFEALDISGIPGPRQSRLHHLTSPLLQDFKIYAAPPFYSTKAQEVETIVKLLGGEVVSKPEDLLQKNGKICLIITETKDSQDTEIYENWLDTLRVASVYLDWLSHSVARYERQGLPPYSLCSEDIIYKLDYPPELLIEASPSQTTISM